MIGSILAWIIQLIEINLYHFEIGVDSPIGLFEDEFIRQRTRKRGSEVKFEMLVANPIEKSRF